MPHQLADGFKADIVMRPRTGLQNLITVLPEPLIPLLSLPVGIIEHIVQTQTEHLQPTPYSLRHFRTQKRWRWPQIRLNTGKVPRFGTASPPPVPFSR
ncbi:MAG: hypothetical protein DMG69_02255 [Acidobacteria bacterium]|nr:MAG: hypothetical protein DMG69_02255 [Acidobacteriota bacterium]